MAFASIGRLSMPAGGGSLFASAFSPRRLGGLPPAPSLPMMAPRLGEGGMVGARSASASAAFSSGQLFGEVNSMVDQMF